MKAEITEKVITGIYDGEYFMIKENSGDYDVMWNGKDARFGKNVDGAYSNFDGIKDNDFLSEIYHGEIGVYIPCKEEIRIQTKEVIQSLNTDEMLV